MKINREKPHILSRGEFEALIRLLGGYGHFAGGDLDWHILRGDGSDRRFLRIWQSGGLSYIAVFPNRSLEKGRQEAAASFQIGRHLAAAGVPVPEILGYDEESRLVLFEDLGDRLLQEYAADKRHGRQQVLELYVQAVCTLARLQIKGAENFDSSWCWDTPIYDFQLMRAGESDYFRNAFCRDFLGLTLYDERLEREFDFLAQRAASEPSGFVLHRDFQSRNLIVKDNTIRIIDFQGARLGPLAYDLASLLIDPYVALNQKEQRMLTDKYLDAAGALIDLDREDFLAGYDYLALQRNLQILGAFAFLSGIKGKVFFRQFIPGALASLREILNGPAGLNFPGLLALIEEIITQKKYIQE